MFRAVEFVAERAGKTPFDPARKLHDAIKRAAFARGLLVYAMGGTIDGVRGDHVMLAPPYNATPDEIDFCVATLGTAIDAVFAG